MKKTIKLFLIIIVVLAVSLIVLFWVIGAHGAKTDKRTYNYGEEIEFSWWDLGIRDCGETYNEFYRKVDNIWEDVGNPDIDGYYCQNGKLNKSIKVGWPPRCEFSSHIFYDKGNIKSKFHIYVKNKKDEICDDEKEAIFFYNYKGEPIPSYSRIIAPPGEYKVKHGRAEAKFIIK